MLLSPVASARTILCSPDTLSARVAYPLLRGRGQARNRGAVNLAAAGNVGLRGTLHLVVHGSRLGDGRDCRVAGSGNQQLDHAVESPMVGKTDSDNGLKGITGGWAR